MKNIKLNQDVINQLKADIEAEMVRKSQNVLAAEGLEDSTSVNRTTDGVIVDFKRDIALELQKPQARVAKDEIIKELKPN